MSYFQFDLPIVVFRNVVQDGKNIIYADGVMDKAKIPEHTFFYFEKQAGRVSKMIETEKFQSRVEKFKEWSIFTLYSRHFLNEEIYSRVLYSIGKPTDRMLRDRLKKSPIPFKEEWVEDIIEECYSSVLPNLAGEIEIYKTIFPTEERMKKIIEIACKKEYWKHFHKRVPQKAVVFSNIFAPERFNFKNWMSFLKIVGGIEYFEKLKVGAEEAEARINLWEIIGNEAATKGYYDDFDWHTVMTRNPLIAIREGKDEQKVVSKIKRGLQFLWNEDKERIPFLFMNFQNIYKKNWSNKDELLEIIDNIVYPEVRVPEVARVCSYAKMSEDAYKMAEDFWLLCEERVKNSSVGVPTLKGSVKDYTWEMLDPRNPRWLTVGVETNCCQHLGSVGGACVRYIGEHPDSATTFVITRGKKVIAQSFTWISDEGDLVFDNIEILGDDVRKDIIQCYFDYMSEAKRSLKSFGVQRAIVGGGYDDAGVENYFSKIATEDKVEVPSDLGYSDIKNLQYLVWNI